MSFLQGFEKIARADEPLAMHTWFQLGGPAEYFAEPRSVDELVALIHRCHQHGVPVRILGGGSNLLVRDEGVPGMVVRLSEPAFCQIEIRDQIVLAGAGAPLGRVITAAIREGLAGIENLVAIPGTLGGAVRGNAGAPGGDIGQWVRATDVLTQTGELRTRTRDDLIFGHRHSNIDELVILNVYLELQREDPRPLARRLQTLWILRRGRQPMGHQCAGRIFKDPRGTTAAELIEQAGLKGTRIGGAVVSERKANFIVAEPECTSADVLRLIDLVRSQVAQRLGIELELEIEIW